MTYIILILLSILIIYCVINFIRFSSKDEVYILFRKYKIENKEKRKKYLTVSFINIVILTIIGITLVYNAIIGYLFFIFILCIYNGIAVNKLNN